MPNFFRLSLDRLVLPSLVALALLAPSAGHGAAAQSAPPLLTWSLGKYDFGSVAAGQKPSQTFTLSNTGGRSTGAIQVTKSGSLAFVITADGCTGTALGPDKSCSVTVEYAPTNTNGDTGILAADSKQGTPASLSLSGAQQGLHRAACPNGGTTTVTGTVYAPNGIDPLPNVLVYVPNAPVAPFSPGVQCLPAGQMVSGSPLVHAVSGVDGTFSLTNMPVGVNIPLVIQAGRWRRQVTIPNVAACVSTALIPAMTHLPRDHTEGDIPKIAIVTGSVDSTECVLRKVGIADSEFSDPQGTGRINLYKGAGSAGAQFSDATPSETTLWGSQSAINQYDMVMFSCQGAEYNKTPAEQQIVVNYANAGGRVFASHYAYTWLYNATPFSSTANWAVNQPPPTAPQTAVVNQSFAKGAQLARWLMLVKATTNQGQIAISTPRRDLNGVVAPTQSWLSINQSPVQLTFDTPVGAASANQCGRVLFNDYHVENSSTTGMTFPAECPGGSMTGEEKLLEFDLFELSGGQ